MSADNISDILMEIKKVDKQISERKLEVQKSQQDFINLQRKLYHTKELQSKALKIYHEMERKMEIVELDLKGAHKNFDATFELLSEHMEIDKASDEEELLLKIEDLKKHRDLLQLELVAAEKARENMIQKINDIEIQTKIQKKRNAATKIRLQKCLQELLQDEKKLEDELKSLTNN